jgi:uncharacterized protein (TIGR00255 family)
MIRSMTGYGSAAVETDAVRAAVTVKSVNHRFLDSTVHLPRRLQGIEPDVREAIARGVGRGRVELSVQASIPETPGEGVVPSRALVASLVRVLRDMQNEFGLEGGVAVSDLIRFPGALERIETSPELPAEVRECLLGLVAEALEGLDAMRRAEGGRLGAELERALMSIEGVASRLETLSQGTREAQKAALVEKARELLREIGLDEARLYQEVVRAVERHDVTEELQRLRSHAAMARELLGADGAPTGKRLDFLAQELMREANTIGSKIADAEAIQVVVDLKAEIERLREQVQNVE